jgi:hypothetical protein
MSIISNKNISIKQKKYELQNITIENKFNEEKENVVQLYKNSFLSFSNNIYFLLFTSLILITSTTVLVFQNISNYKTFPLSSIASQKEMDLISNWINPNSSFKYSLLYKASRDGDVAYKFHELCNSKKTTLTIISTMEGWKFGGYTDTSWEDMSDDDWFDGDSDFKTTNYTFLFSLNLRNKYPSINNRPEIRTSVDKGPTFGRGPDIHVVNNFRSRFSTCRAPYSFGNMKHVNEFNGGKGEFMVKEIEVFYVEEI